MVVVLRSRRVRPRRPPRRSSSYSSSPLEESLVEAVFEMRDAIPDDVYLKVCFLAQHAHDIRERAEKKVEIASGHAARRDARAHRRTVRSVLGNALRDTFTALQTYVRT